MITVNLIDSPIALNAREGLFTYNSLLYRTYAKTLYIAHDNFDELHALSRALAELCVSNSLTIFIQKTNSNSSQINFILIEGYFN